MPSMMRRMRTRLPTYLSTGLGVLVDISNTPWDRARTDKAGGICLRRRYRQMLSGELVNTDNLSNEPTGSIPGWPSQNANCTLGLSIGVFPLAGIFIRNKKQSAIYRRQEVRVRKFASRRAAE